MGADGVLHTLASRKCGSALDAARTLLRNGEDPQTDFGGTTPLHIAASQDNTEMVQLLLHFGADPMKRNKEGNTAFDVAHGQTREFLIRLLSIPPRKQRSFLRRIFMCYNTAALQRLVRGTRKNLRRIASMHFVRRPPSISDPLPLPKDSHDPHPLEMVVEDDPLPLESAILPGTPLRSSSPSLPNTAHVTTKRGGRVLIPKAVRVVSASSTPGRVCRVRSRSFDENLVQSRKKRKATPSKGGTPNPVSSAKLSGVHGEVITAMNGSSAKKTGPVVPTGRTIQPSAPPLELTLEQRFVDSELYFTADDSLLDELGSRLEKINLTAPEVTRVQKLTVAQLRDELRSAGIQAGPINKDSRKGYEKKLILSKNQKQDPKATYSFALNQALRGTVPFNGDKLDQILLRELDTGARCFVYLLIDPRSLPPGEVSLENFVSSVFYVGKATGERPLAHLVDAKRARLLRPTKAATPQKNAAKIERINDVWNSGEGVLTLELGKNIGNELALTREGCIMTAIGPQLTNIRTGEFHGAARSWDARRRAEYGSYLLGKAHRIFNADRPVAVMPRNVPDQLFGKKK